MVAPFISAIAVLCLLAIANVSALAGHDVSISVDLGNTHSVSEKLYGIFFEEINHAGEGGLYAELLQDRSFDALAYTSGFDAGGPVTDELSRERLEMAARPLYKSHPKRDFRVASEKAALTSPDAISQPPAWQVLNSTKMVLSRGDPISANNPVAVEVTAFAAGGGITNGGYWGIPLKKGQAYHFSVYLKGNKSTKVKVLLTSPDGGEVFSEAQLDGLTSTWHKFSANLTSNSTTSTALLAVILATEGKIALDSLSLFPLANLRAGWQNPFPFRADLLQLLKDLQPRFLRFPGGCYVEGGDWLANRFPWKTSLGLYEDRKGHLNDIWGYWSTDGLGLYEYMLLADELGAEPIYVVNNGVSHQQAIPPQQLQPFLDETMEALAFLTAGPETTWGGVRASMGREKPWEVNYLAIGNEDCGRPYYVEDYNLFFKAIKAEYPNITLISNCPMGDAAPTELWDWHSYDDSWTMFNRMHEFDNYVRGQAAPVFVSEYAVVQDGGWGNLRGAVAEASFMTGMERNSDLVKLASYAPLFVHTKNRIWPTNMIVFDNSRAYKTPSYLVQKLFSQFQGVTAAATAVQTTSAGSIHNDLVAASATCQDVKCQKLAVKAANYASFNQTVKIRISAPGGAHFAAAAKLHHVSGSAPEQENSFEHPESVVITSDDISIDGVSDGDSFAFTVSLPAWSASALELERSPSPSVARLDAQLAGASSRRKFPTVESGRSFQSFDKHSTA